MKRWGGDFSDFRWPAPHFQFQALGFLESFFTF